MSSVRRFLPYERPAAALVVLLVHEGGEDDFSLARARSAGGEFEERGEVGGDAAFGVARAASVQATRFHDGLEARFAVHAHGVHVRCEQDAAAHLPAGGGKADEQIGTAWENLLPL